MEVKVLWNNWSQEFLANRKAKKARKGSDREAGAERSGEQSRGSTNRNRMRGEPAQGERAEDCEALVTNGLERRPGDRAVKVMAITWGGLALRLKGRR